MTTRETMLEEELERARAELAFTKGFIRGQREVLEALVAKIDDLAPLIASVIQIAALHGMPWPADKNWVKEIAEARQSLKNSAGV
jgi:hypothetical protein